MGKFFGGGGEQAERTLRFTHMLEQASNKIIEQLGRKELAFAASVVFFAPSVYFSFRKMNVGEMLSVFL